MTPDVLAQADRAFAATTDLLNSMITSVAEDRSSLPPDTVRLFVATAAVLDDLSPKVMRDVLAAALLRLAIPPARSDDWAALKDGTVDLAAGIVRGWESALRLGATLDEYGADHFAEMVAEGRTHDFARDELAALVTVLSAQLAAHHLHLQGDQPL